MSLFLLSSSGMCGCVFVFDDIRAFVFCFFYLGHVLFSICLCVFHFGFVFCMFVFAFCCVSVLYVVCFV